ASRRAGWLPKDPNEYPICTHVGFGLVLGDDGKRFRSRSSETVRLVDLLDEAKRRCKVALLEPDNAKEWTEEEIEKTSEAIGYGAVKFSWSHAQICYQTYYVNTYIIWPRSSQRNFILIVRLLGRLRKLADFCYVK
ncbi:hypothetical protein KIW84_011217, partial [Lathyrus oleraceus]